jgi:hypothetical protein
MTFTNLILVLSACSFFSKEEPEVVDTSKEVTDSAVDSGTDSAVDTNGSDSGTDSETPPEDTSLDWESNGLECAVPNNIQGWLEREDIGNGWDTYPPDAVPQQDIDSDRGLIVEEYKEGWNYRYDLVEVCDLAYQECVEGDGNPSCQPCDTNFVKRYTKLVVDGITTFDAVGCNSSAYYSGSYLASCSATGAQARNWLPGNVETIYYILDENSEPSSLGVTVFYDGDYYSFSRFPNTSTDDGDGLTWEWTVHSGELVNGGLLDVEIKVTGMGEDKWGTPFSIDVEARIVNYCE